MYRYKVIDIHPEDPWFEKIEIGQVLESWSKADINERSPICRDTLKGFSRAYIAGRHFFAIKVEDITGKQEVEPAPWIPVSERLPENGEDVLVCDGDAMAVACFNTKDRVWDFFELDFWSSSDVTHWMPLPEPPKK